jgi:hypothetical protein
VFVDRASMLKRYHPCAHGRAKPILKRSCHVTVQLEHRAAPKDAGSVKGGKGAKIDRLRGGRAAKSVKP